MNPTAATILIVDDEAANRKLLEALLRPEGYLTMSAGSGEQALSLVAQRPPDLILLDVMMPGLNGYEVARKLKANTLTSAIPIIMVTALIDRAVRLAGLDAGAEDFLEKPVDRAELWLRVRNLLRLKALADLLQDHSSILEKEVAARTGELNASELRFRQMAENIRDVFFLREATGNRVLYVSRAYEEIWGRSCESLYLDPDSWDEATHPDDRAAAEEKRRNGMLSGRYEVEHRIIRPEGAIRWIESRVFPVYDEANRIVRFAGVAKDVTERREAQDRIAYLNRVYAMLSGINALIVRARDRDELFKEACRIAVAGGGFRLSLVALVDPHTRKTAPVASAGVNPEILTAVTDLLSSGEGARNTMIARAIEEKRTIISNDSQTDPSLVSGGRYVEAGVRSIAVLPLVASDEVVGVLALYASEPEFFHEEEMKLLTELAGDIGFAIDTIEKRERLNYLAYYDALTGLANRTLFLERVAQYMRSAMSGEHQLALFLIDLERFKNINDSLGQTAGDALLKQVAAWLTRSAGDGSLISRVGADHFALVLPNVKNQTEVIRVLERTVNGFSEHAFRLNESIFRIAVKVGVAVFPADAATAEALFANAEAALKKAKATSERYLFYTQTMTDKVAGQLTMENNLRPALEKREFVLHYQPKVNLESGKVTSAEALIRWNDPRTGLVPPGRFIPILEETGLINEVGRWSLRQAVEDFLRWRAEGLGAVRLAVNVSPRQLRNPGFVAEIKQVLGDHPHACEGLELEITESLIMEDVRSSITTLRAIRDLGVTVAIDDFGTGFSSLSYLARLPVDTLKIDRSFVIEMTTGPQGLALVSTIINLAHSLKLKVVAEGVETDEQSRLLRLLGCEEMQGFLFSEGIPGALFESRYLARLAAA